MKYLLDTNTCIRYLNRRSPAVVQRLEATDETLLALCSVVKGELYLGALKSQTPEATLHKQRLFAERFDSLPFDDAAAWVYSQLRAGLEQVGQPIGANDMMIAAIAMANDLILVTHNVKEFGRVQGLKYEDWEYGEPL